MSVEYEQLKGQIVLLTDKLDSYTKSSHELLMRHNDTLYGNGKEGLTSIMSRVLHELKSHTRWDFGFYTLILGLLGAILIKVVFNG